MKKETQSQNKRGKHTDYDATSHVRDVNVIWHDYKTKQNAIKKNANRRKYFVIH